jgi:hypothetical protein
MIENRDDLCLGESTFFHSGVWSDPYNLSALFMPSLQSNRNFARCTVGDFVAYRKNFHMNTNNCRKKFLPGLFRFDSQKNNKPPKK